jgi:hypothetical protein
MKTLSISLYNRPQYTSILLDSLDKCYDIDNYKVFIYCEPTNQDVINLAKKFRSEQTKLTINSTKLGCNKNIYQAIDNGFLDNDFHIHLEDDTIPAKDFLIYCEWCRNHYYDNSDIFSVSGYVNSNNKIEQFVEKNTDYQLISTRQWFTPWGWATWKNRWMLIKELILPYLDQNMSWDYVLHNIIKHKKECFPMVSRIQNIGAENGTYCPGFEWHKDNQYNEYWIETDQQYQTSFIFKNDN